MGMRSLTWLLLVVGEGGEDDIVGNGVVDGGGRSGMPSVVEAS